MSRDAFDTSHPTRQLLIWGMLWGLIVSIAECAAIPGPDGFFASLYFWSIQWPTLAWCVAGCVFLLVARRALRAGSRRQLVRGWLVVALPWAILGPFSSPGGWQPNSPQVLLEIIAYNMFPAIFFSAILVATYAFATQAEATRALLRDAEIARSRTNALRGEAELSNLQKHVDPALLLDVMADVERRYRTAPDQADDLLARFVEFLRCAMPGLKDRMSTLRAEIQLARAFLSLQALRNSAGHEAAGPEFAHWRIDDAGGYANVSFPSQLILPMLALASPKEEPRLLLVEHPGGVRLEIHQLGSAVPEAFARHARSSLKALLGDAFALRVGEVDNPQLAIALGLSATPGDGHGI